MNTPGLHRPLLSAVLMGGLFAAAAFAMQLAAPLRIVLGSLLVALVGAIVTYRRDRGMTLLPTPVLVAFGLGGLALYGWVFLIRERPVGSEWLAVSIVFVVPVALLLIALRHSRTRT